MDQPTTTTTNDNLGDRTGHSASSDDQAYHIHQSDNPDPFNIVSLPRVVHDDGSFPRPIAELFPLEIPHVSADECVHTDDGSDHISGTANNEHETHVPKEMLGTTVVDSECVVSPVQHAPRKSVRATRS
ncbi:hypothetical protein V6N11_044052 [Hibiscus sabdariffa]|uniref:Uncharacterized protein n=1 Tax=Hibiscus sabdariffa TaxID=183260 RepID=A0ABR2RED9_9ROSI